MTDLPVEFNAFMAESESDYDWLIPGLLEKGDRTIITGGEGKGKSTLMRQVAIQVASGIHPFTREAIEPKRVLLVDLENPSRILRRKMREMTEGRSDIPYGMLHVWRKPEGIDLLHPLTRQSFAKVLSDFWPELLIIGPMYKMAEGLDKEDASKHLSAALDEWRVQYEFALLMESHQPHQVITQNDKFRPERPFGSSLWLRWPEFGMCLEDGGMLRHWRGARDERDWPEKLTWGDEWPWIVDEKKCLVCGNPRPETRLKYCSDKCSATGRKRDSRAKDRLL